MAMTVEGARRLQEHIQEIKRSGKSWEDIGSTLRSYVEKGVPPNPQDSTLVRLDGLMGWIPGSARLVFEGGEPAVPEAVQPIVNDRAVALMRRIAALADEAADLLEKGQ